MHKFNWAICGCCDGHGKVDHPAFSNGFTGSEWAEACQEYDDAGESFAERYLSGAYDVPCHECGGTGKVKVPNIAALTFAEKRELVEQRRAERDRYYVDAMQAAERRMGA